MLLQELLVIKKRSLFQSLCQWMETIENARGQVTSGVWERKGVAGPRSRSSPARFLLNMNLEQATRDEVYIWALASHCHL